MDGRNGHGAQAETNRDRVRRLLFVPLGFRHRREVDEAQCRHWLDTLADELGYMRDARLVALAELMRGHGQGAARNFWPDRATFIGFAEMLEPRPLDQLPAVCSWFGSVEGPAAMRAGTLVETWQYIQRAKKPPYTDQARRQIAEAAALSRRRLDIIAERRQLGLPLNPDDLAWEAWYRRLSDHCAEVVTRERSARGHLDGATGHGVAA